jgi:cytochrome c-type biogenesis protein CcmH/NrfG
MRRTIKTRRRSDVLFVLLPTLDGYGRTRFAIDNMREGMRAASTGDWPAATRHFTEALESDYTLIKLRLYIATGLYMQGRLSESHETLRGYINVRNSDTTAMLAYALMGVIREEQSQVQDALTAYKLALKLHSSVASVINLPPARTDGEVAALQEAVRQAPEDPRLLYRLGVAFEHKGRHAEGMQAMRRALFSLATI